MRSFILPLAFCVCSVAGVQGQTPDFNVDVSTFFPTGMAFNAVIQNAPAFSPYTVYYVIGNPFLDPFSSLIIGQLYSSSTNGAGSSTVNLQLQAPPGVNVSLPEFWSVALITPPTPAAPTIPTELIALSLRADIPPPPVPAPCVHEGAMSYHPDDCLIIVKVKVCPGDVVDLNVNGAMQVSGVAGASGIVILSINRCLGLSDNTTVNVNGMPFLGPIRDP